VFNYYGYSLSLHFKYGVIRKGNFKIIKINFGEHLFDNFEQMVAFQEIKLNISRQKYKHNKDKQKLSQTQKKLHIDNNKQFVIGLSSYGISKLLGYQAKSTGYKIRKQLELNGSLSLSFDGRGHYDYPIMTINGSN